MRCVPAHDFTVAKAMAWHSSIADDPPYQRQGSIWSLDQQQLFIDSLLNGYDVPKIYLHDLRGRHPTRVYAIVDGKQRLTTIWRYLTNAFGLADDYRTELKNLPDLPSGVRHPRAGDRYADLDPAWQRVLRTTYLAVVLIQNANPSDIEDLFSRLNNGEPLTPAERRNARGGGGASLVRTVARHPFFRETVSVDNRRLAHHDLAARMILLEQATQLGQPPPSLNEAALNGFVSERRRIPTELRRAVTSAITDRLDALATAFEPADRLLHSADAVLLAYAALSRLDASPASARRVREALAESGAGGRGRRRHDAVELLGRAGQLVGADSTRAVAGA